MTDKEFVSCGECHNGYVYGVDAKTGVRTAQRCRCYTQWLRQRKKEILFEKAGLSELDAQYSIEEYIGTDRNENIPKVKMYVDEFEDRFRHINLYFWSRENGSQKTTVSKWMVGQLAEQGFKVRFILMENLVRMIQKTEWDGTDSDKMSYITDVDFLVVDDAFDPAKNMIYKSGYQFPFVDTFFRDRLETRKKATVFTSNIPPEEIAEHYTASIGALINRNIPDPFEFTDLLDNGQLRRKLNTDLWGERDKSKESVDE